MVHLFAFFKLKHTPCDPLRLTPRSMKDLAKNGEGKAKMQKGDLYHILESFMDSPNRIQFVSCRLEGFTRRLWMDVLSYFLIRERWASVLLRSHLASNLLSHGTVIIACPPSSKVRAISLTALVSPSSAGSTCSSVEIAVILLKKLFG